ncbi:MAG: hypothetical protein AAF843_08145 [Bacteroidota bacterium]
MRSFDSTDLERVFPVVQNLPFRTKSDALNHLKFFHLVDYNNDYKIDVFYEGSTGGEGTMLHVIQNTGNNFEIVQTIYGSVQDIKVQNNKITEFQILDYACCAGYVDHLQLWSSKGTSKYSSVNDLALIVGTNIPSDQFDKPINFKITNERYNMRLEPEIKELGENDVPFNPIDGQNISASFTSGNTGTAIAQKEDETGRIWWLVIMDQMPNSEFPKLFYEGNNDIYNYKPVGWISSRYVEKIKK